MQSSETAPPIDLLAIGETMALVVPTTAEPLETATDFHLAVGGAESNVACQLAEAGRRAAWFSALGDDPLGRRVLTALAEHGVDTSRVRIDASAPTGLYVKDPGRGATYYRKGSAASRLTPEDLAGSGLSRARVVHLSGITLALSPSCRELVHAAIAAAHEAGALVSFDVNHRPALWPTAEEAATAILEAARTADVVLVGRDEAAELWRTVTADAVRELLPDVPHLVVKDSDIEAVEFSPAGRAAVATPPVQVVEPVGAGDAFAAGWIDALLSGHDAEERLARGHAWAARTLASMQDIPVRGAGSDGEEASA